MNFLAHLYLSGENEQVLLGNFIGDYVKGRKYLDYPEGVQKGIVLHRNIDSFTDTHALVKESVRYFREGYGRYSGIVVDVIFDYFLAKYWSDFSDLSLKKFTQKAHSILLSNFGLLPGRVQLFLPIMIKSKRLASYASYQGIKKALDIMSNYSSLPDASEFCIEILKKEEDNLQKIFQEFISDLIIYVETGFEVKIKRPNS